MLLVYRRSEESPRALLLSIKGYSRDEGCSIDPLSGCRSVDRDFNDPELPGDLPRLLRADIFLGKPFDEL
jgi:hypothetical protein